MPRYVVAWHATVEGVENEYLVIDTQYLGITPFRVIARCFVRSDAEAIAAALNS